MKKVRTTRVLAGLVALAAMVGCTTLAGVDETYVLREDMFCEPSKAQSCYSGPPDTEGKGVCKAGLQVCDDKGEAFGPCLGEVVPSLESCTTTDVDESCEGEPTCAGALLWSKSLSGGFFYTSYLAAVDRDGNLILPGNFSADIDFGGGTMKPVGMDDIYLSKFDPQGELLWSKSFGGSGNDYPGDVAVNYDGSIILVGSFEEVIDFGGEPMQTAGGPDIFVAKFDADGNHLWSKQYGDAESQYANEVAIDGDGYLVVAGNFGGSIDFGGGPIVSTGNEIFLTRLDPDGEPVWAKNFGAMNSDPSVRAMALDPGGNILLTGGFTGDLSLGGPVMTNLDSDSIWVAKLDPAGEYLWSTQYGDSGPQYGEGIVADSQGNIILGATFTGSIDFGGGPIQSHGNYDVTITKLKPDGGYLWSQSFGDLEWDELYGLAIDGNDNVLVTGSFQGTITIDGSSLTASQGAPDIYAAKFDAAGKNLWTKRFGDGDSQSGTAIVVDSIGNSLLVSLVAGTADFGGGAIGAVDTDVMLAKFGP